MTTAKVQTLRMTLKKLTKKKTKLRQKKIITIKTSITLKTFEQNQT